MIVNVPQSADLFGGPVRAPRVCLGWHSGREERLSRPRVGCRDSCEAEQVISGWQCGRVWPTRPSMETEAILVV
jgi:hypothetical protein